MQINTHVALVDPQSHPHLKLGMLGDVYLSVPAESAHGSAA